MFKCKECGAEYEIKPDYCDCGNDEFIVIEEQKELKEEPKAETKVKKEKPAVQPASQMNFHNKKYDYKKIQTVDSWALAIFGICILLSIYVIFFAWNPKENLTKSDESVQTTVNKKLPSIDKIWNNALPEIKKEDTKKEDSVGKIVKQIIPPAVQKKPVQQNKPQTSQPKVTKVPLVKSGTKQTVQSAKKQTDNNANIAKQKADEERKAAEAAQLKKLQSEQAKKEAEERARKSALSKQELANYKAQLRNTLGRKIDFTKVIGDGSCTVAFKIDSNGRLINRSFAKQSSNNTLNDAVYEAIMSTPVFNQPPAAYNNEILNLNIKFYNGNFEISLP